MRDLPDQLREISGQVTRASQQPEETNRLVRETSERLQTLVAGLEAKLMLLLENKENLEGVRQAVLKVRGCRGHRMGLREGVVKMNE